MRICVATVLSIALLLGNSVNLQASVTGPDPSDGDGHASQVCQTCCQDTAAIVGILQGSKGDAGEKGQIGPVGPWVRVKGAPGVKGQTGLKGDAGIDGQIGPQGPKGLVGPTGPTGVKGQRGEVGPIGPQGDTGPKGLVGSTGQTGVKGQKGGPGETQDDSNQRVAFTVVRRSDSDTSTSESTRLPFQETETLLPGTNFDLETGIFTCSVPGTYVLLFSVNNYPTSSELYVHLRKNGAVVVCGHSKDSSNNEQVSGSAVLVLQRGDEVYLTLLGRANSGIWHDTSFSGFLLYPE